ncbi:hypothetical protein HMN09_01107800 [Mycena chlorophos]|uniref:BTB domain-containing protein n=1 Tax=Mycena chlorophos TaxID=658473 RepID=A0A8H6SCF5_MYCCL|nr:hypothetical protein HMN09_01107800 [Mycena chlorophos]
MSEFATVLERPVKRARPDSGPPYVRDQQFYDDEAPAPSVDWCIVSAENVLFKVQRSLLMRDSPLFSTLFGLPQGQLPAEGQSDAYPIVLAGDTASDFRALLTYLTKPGFELIPKDIPLDEFQNLLSLGKMAHKYQMSGWERWTGTVLIELVDKHARRLSTKDFSVALDLAMLLSHASLRDAVTDNWYSMVSAARLPILDAMDIAERHAQRSFLVRLYTQQLKLVCHETQQPPSPFVAVVTFQALRGLQPIHSQRILAAHSSLSIAWSAFRRLEILPRREPGCSPDHHERTCCRKFRSVWLEAINTADSSRSLPLTSLRQRVLFVQDQLAHYKQDTMINNPGDRILSPMARTSPGIYCIYVDERDEIKRVLAALPLTNSLDPYFFAAEA